MIIDEQLVYLRGRWKEKAAHLSDEQLTNRYRMFCLTGKEDRGENDCNFEVWLSREGGYNTRRRGE